MTILRKSLAIAAAAVVAGSVGTASAGTCQSSIVFAQSVSVKGSRYTTSEAIQNWKTAAESKYGALFADWNQAQNKSITCLPVTQNSTALACQAIARPCSDATWQPTNKLHN